MLLTFLLQLNSTQFNSPRRFADSTEDADFHKQMFEKYVHKILTYKEINCTEPVPVSDFNAVKSLIDLYDALATEANGVIKPETESPAKFYALSEKWFVFSMIWSIMAAVDEEGRRTLDQYLREIEAQFPPMQTVYDFFVDPKKGDFELWESKIPTWRPRKGAAFHSLIVPTTDTVRNSYILTTLVNANKQVLVTGLTGTGKTILCQVSNNPFNFNKTLHNKLTQIPNYV